MRGATNLCVLPLAGWGEGRSALSHLIDFTNLGKLLHPLHTCMWGAEQPFLFRENLLFATPPSSKTLSQEYKVICVSLLSPMVNGFVAQYLLVVTPLGQPGSHQAPYILRRYNPNNSCDYYKCVSKVGHSLAVTSSYLPTKQSSSAHITHLLSIGDPIHGRRRDKHLAKIITNCQ